jgi:isoleucyl-tRNA synthetase
MQLLTNATTASRNIAAPFDLFSAWCKISRCNIKYRMNRSAPACIATSCTASYTLYLTRQMWLKYCLIDHDQLPLVDKHFLCLLHDVTQSVKRSYEQYHFTGVFHTLQEFNVNVCSAFYMDISKDRLYVEHTNAHTRR